jgi:hypothetical protein
MQVETFHIGPHTPAMKTEDVHLVHRLWLNLTREPGLDKLHHNDILTEALTRFARDYAGREHDEILRDLRKGTGKTVVTRPLGGDGSSTRSSGSAKAASDLDSDEKDDTGSSNPPLLNP